MSARECPFWCRVHDDGLTVLERPHEAAATTLADVEGVPVRLTLLQGKAARWPRIELEVAGHTAALTNDDGQAIIAVLRELIGMSMRSRAVSR